MTRLQNARASWPRLGSASRRARVPMYLSNDLVVFDPGDDVWPAPYRAWEMAAAAKV